MPTDGIKQLGKYIRQTGAKSDFALSRVQKRVPKVERTRDIYDYEVSFNFDFATRTERPTVRMDLILTPPPMDSLGCCGDCFCAVSERFIGGSTDYPLFYTPLTGSLYLYINDVRSTNYSLAGQTVTVNTSTEENDSVRFMYVYQYGDCDTGTVEVPAHETWENFDRVVANRSWGSTWTVSSGDASPTASVDGDIASIVISEHGTLAEVESALPITGSQTISARFKFNVVPTDQDYTDTGFWVKTSGDSQIARLTLHACTVSATLGGYGWIELYSYDNINSDWDNDFVFQNNTYYQMKLYVDATTTKAKVWLDSGTEPANWMLETTANGSAAKLNVYHGAFLANYGQTTGLYIDWIDTIEN